MSGFEKIDLISKTRSRLQSKTDGDDMSNKKRTRKRFQLSRKNLGMMTGIFLVIALLLTFGLIVPGISLAKSAQKTYTQAKIMADALKQQNIELASVELEKTKVALADTQKKMRPLIYLKFIPLANFYYNDAEHGLNAGAEGLKAATIVVDSLKPYADVLGLKGQGSFAGGSAEDRIKTAVLSMGKITPRIDEISDSLLVVRKEVDGINPDHYPEFLFGKNIKSQITQLKLLTDQGVEFVDEARPLIKVLPSLLGEKEEKKYLVIFQNDKELRPTGGFMTAYAIFRLDKGVIKLDRSDDIYVLDDSIPNKPKAPEPILKYLPKVSTLNLRDSNLSPDFIVSMNEFNKLYDRAGQKVEVDGIIAIDTYVLVETIKVLDNQISVNGQTYTTEEDARCDCPQVIYELEDNISRPVNYVRTDRKALLGDMLTALMSKALSSSPKQYWGPLFQTMLNQTYQKHVLFYLYDKDAQSGIEALNAAGKILPFEGDYLHINDTNFGGAKSNLFVTQEVEVAYDVKSDGAVQKTITVDYKNTYPPSDCNLERGGLCLNAELRDWIRFYVPSGSTLGKNTGSEVKMTTSEDLGKTVLEGFVTVRPLGKTKLTVTYDLPFKVEGGVLPVLIQKQPGTYGPQYTIKVNGKTVEKFELLTDKELKLKV